MSAALKNYTGGPMYYLYKVVCCMRVYLDFIDEKGAPGYTNDLDSAKWYTFREDAIKDQQDLIARGYTLLLGEF
jgi:hypothetical protein